MRSRTYWQFNIFIKCLSQKVQKTVVVFLSMVMSELMLSQNSMHQFIQNLFRLRNESDDLNAKIRSIHVIIDRYSRLRLTYL